LISRILATSALALALVTGAFAPASHPAAAQTATEKALTAANKRDWGQAYATAGQSGDPVLRKLVAWADYATPGTKASFADISAFLKTNPNWPGQAIMRRNAEEAMNGDASDRQVLDWFSGGEPRTTNGRMRLIQALYNVGRREEATAYMRRSWIEGNFGSDQEKTFLKLYGSQLRKEDHSARLDRLLWDGRGPEAQRMFRHVSQGEQALATARIQLRGMGSGVEGALRKVPKDLQNNPGLIYERLRWRRRKERDEDARALLAKPPANLVRPDLWFDERSILARRALRTGQASVAYKLVDNPGQASGATLAEAEWLAGWIALRFLNDPTKAIKHFTNLHDNARYPVTMSRGAYWAGRAAEAKKDAALAKQWYGKAAQHVTTFYGQLAAPHLGSSLKQFIPPDPEPTAAARKTFDNRELVKATKLVARSGNRAWLRSFVLTLMEEVKTPDEQELVTELAVSLQRPDLAVVASKHAVRLGVQLVQAGYPTALLPKGGSSLENALLLAVMRQESAFDVEATSSAGARGLMQLMPSTAKMLARDLQLPYAPERLTSDPHYNMRLGSYYLSSIISDFDDSYVMGIAAYNAGPSRVRAWIRAYGDPRTGAIDMIDWIELIPFEETRNYVQRVLENLQIYRSRLNDAKMVSLREDLDRPRSMRTSSRR
jgi:soluble lytic murein transglycosylase